MNNHINSIFAVISLFSTVATAEISNNISVTSNYINRGITQTSDSASVAGGVDYTHSSGFYVGLWSASLSNDTETNLYTGYRFKINSIEYDVGYDISQFYTPGIDVSEVFFGVSLHNISGKYSVDSDNNNTYLEISADFALTDIDILNIHTGINNAHNGVDYQNYSVSLTRQEISFTLSNTNNNMALGMSDNVRYVVLWQREF